MRARLYDPNTGRFTGGDPIAGSLGNPSSLNRYAYTGNNPVTGSDPSGMGGPDAACEQEGEPAAACGAAALMPGGFPPADGEPGSIQPIVDLPGAVQGLEQGASALADEAISATGETIRAFRVEGDPNRRIDISEGGMVRISGDRVLFLNFGDARRATELYQRRLSQGMSGVAIKSFDVRTEFLEYLRRNAVPYRIARQAPNAPMVVDATRAADQYGLRPAQIERLIGAIIQGSGRVWP